MYEDTSALDVHTGCCSIFPNSDIAASAFLHWSFRSSFALVFGAGALAWFAMTFFFAFIIWIIGSVQGQCIGGVVFENSTSPFMDAYQMSWTTFSTVVSLNTKEVEHLLLHDVNLFYCFLLILTSTISYRVMV